MTTWRRLQARAVDQPAAKVAVVGAGYVGTGVVHAVHHAPGMSPVIVVNRDVARGVHSYTSMGVARADVTVSEARADLERAIAAGRPVVTSSPEVLPDLPVDVVVEATGALNYGTETMLAMLAAGKHVVSFNAEVDALIGRRLHQAAAAEGVIYTIADGDQPGAMFRLQQQIEAMGFEPTAFLNCKRHLDVHQNPETGAGYAARDTTSAVMTTAFGDGTKMQVEQAVVANATGFVPDVRGMHGIESTLETAAVDIPAALSGPGKVDFTLGGDFGAGVGIVATHPQGDLHAQAMRFYKMGDGPEYFFFRPYHLVHLEVPNTIADILIDRVALATVDGPHVAEVVATAKKDLAAGEELDCIGGFTAYGHADTVERATGYLPVGLVQYATMTAPVAQDQPIPLSAVDLDETQTVVREWRALQG